MSNGSIFVLSGEELTFPSAEIRALVESSSNETTTNLAPRVVYSKLSDPSVVSRIALRAAYCRFGGHFVSKAEDFDHLVSVLDNKSIEQGKTFAVASETIEREEYGELGGKIKAITGAKVSLEYPDYVFQVEKTSNGFALGVSKDGFKKSSWRERRPRARKFFLPSAIYPKLAALLVNLSRVKEGELFLDPFCGTASLLIESSIMGMNTIGIDMGKWVARGALQNMKMFSKQDYMIVRADSTSNLPFTKVDAVSTDVPYGRAASTRGKETSRIIREFTTSLVEILPKGRHAVIMHPSHVNLELESKSFQVVEQHLLYVHRNLTRAISVLRRV
jgi:tRNA (guanine10-N2)-dimethyltransferase